MRSNLVSISVPNWEKYNPRSDRTPSWFRFQNNFYDDDKLFDLTNDERHVLLMIFCAVSDSSKSEAVVSMSKIASRLRVNVCFVWSTIEKLASELNLLIITDGTKPIEVRNHDVVGTYEAGSTTYERTNVRTNGTDVTNDSDRIQDLPEPKPENKTVVVNPKKPSADSATAELGKQASQVIARYCELWKARYNTSPAFSQKWAGNAKTLVKDHGLQRSLTLVEAFLEMKDTFFIQRRHSFELLLTSLSQIVHYAGTGAVITNTQLKQIDQAQTNLSLLEKVRAGEV